MEPQFCSHLLLTWNCNSLLNQDVANEIAGELHAKPDLIIGNYSDGNLVASLLAHKLGVTQVSQSSDFPFSFSSSSDRLNCSQFRIFSAPLLMLLRKPSILARISTGRSLMISTTSPASSLPISLP